MANIPWILIVIAALLIVGLFFLIWAKRRAKIPPDYYAFFWIGIAWLIIGLPFKNYALSGIGLVFFIIGLANKDKWKQNRRKWSDLTKREKTAMAIAMAALLALVVAGLVVYYLAEKGIIS